MNPDAVITDEWIDDSKIPGDPNSGKGKTFEHHVLLADGRETRTFYRYGTNEQVGNPEQTTNKDQKSSYDDAVKRATPPGGRPEIAINGQRKGWDPRTGDYTVDLGPVTSTAASTQPNQTAEDEAQAVQDKREKEWNQANGGLYETHAARRTREAKEANDAEAKAAREKAGATAEEARNRPQISYRKVGTKTYKVLTYPDGKEEVSPSALPPDVTDDQVTTINGQPARVVRDENGKATGIEVLPITGQGTDPTFTGSPAPWMPKAVVDDLQSYSKQLNEAVKTGAITPAKASALMEARRKEAAAAIDNQLDAAKTVYGAGITERGQDVSLANARLSASQAGIQQGLSYFKEVNPWLKRGSTAGADAFLAIRNMAYQDAQRYGGLDTFQHTPIPAAVQSAANSITITSPDGTTVTVPHGAGAAASPPAAPAAPAMAPVEPDPGLVGPPPADPQQLAQGPQPTGFAAIDQYSKQIDSGMPTTVSGMEDSFRLAGMEEDAIAASRQNLLGAA